MGSRILTGAISTPRAIFTRPANTTQYASGDLVANSATTADVVAMSWPVAERSCQVRRARLFKDDDDVTAASFRLHLFSANPVATNPANGDNGAIQLNGALKSYLGSVDFDMTASGIDIHADGNGAIGAPSKGEEINVRGVGDLYGLLEARGTYTPASGEEFTVDLEMVQA